MKTDRKSHPVARQVQKRGQLKKAHYTSAGSAHLMQLESRLEASGSIAMGLDSRVRSIRSQPMTFDLATGRTYPSKEALQAAQKLYGLRCVKYTPDFEIDLGGSNLFIEVKHRKFIARDPAVLGYPDILARYGYRLVILDDGILEETYVRNMRLLNIARSVRGGNDEVLALAQFCGGGVPYGQFLAAGFEEAAVLTAIASGKLTCAPLARRRWSGALARADRGRCLLQFTSGFGHRHTMLHKSTIEEIRENRGRFVGKSEVRDILGISRKQYDLFAEAGGLTGCIPESVPPLFEGAHDLVAVRRLVRKLAQQAVEAVGETVAFSDLNLRFTTDRAGLTQVFKHIAGGRLRPVVGSKADRLADFRFVRVEIDTVLAEARRGPGLTVQQIAQMTGWTEQCIAAWCQQGLLNHRCFEHAGKVGRIIQSEDLAEFQSTYVPVAKIARQVETSPRALIAKLKVAGVATVGAFKEGSAWRGHLVPLSVVATVLVAMAEHRDAQEQAAQARRDN